MRPLSFFSPKRMILLVILLYPLSCMVDSILAPVNMYDDAIPLVNAMLTQHGALPYKDFFSVYLPLNEYLNAWIFSLLGLSVVSERILKCSFYALFLIVGFLYAKEEERWQDASKASLMFVLASFGIVLRLPFWNAFVMAALAYLFYLWSQDQNSWKSKFLLFLSGVFSGLTLLTRMNFGLYAITAIVICLGLYNKRKDKIKNAVFYLLPITALVLGFFVYVLLTLKDLHAVFDWTFIYSFSTLQPRNISVSKFFLPILLFPMGWCLCKYVKPIRKKSSHFFWGSFLIILAASSILFYANGHGEILKNLSALALLTSLYPLIVHTTIARLDHKEMSALLMFSFFSHYFLNGPDYVHFFVLVPFVALTFFHMKSKKTSQWRERIGIAASAFFLIMFCFAAVELPRTLADASKLIFSKTSLLQMGDAKFLAFSPLSWNEPEFKIYENKEEIEALRFLNENAHENDPVYIGVENSARSTFNNMRMNWILGRPIAVRHSCFVLGISNKEPVQREMINDLIKHRVQWAVLWKNSFNPAVLWDERGSSNSRLLDHYLHDQYSPVKSFETFTIYRKNKPRTIPSPRSGVI